MLAYKRWLLLLMAGLALGAGAAKGAVPLPLTPLLLKSAKPKLSRHRPPHRVNPARIAQLRAAAWRWQRVMGKRVTRLGVRPSTVSTLRAWQGIARRAFLAYMHPPHEGSWLCIHRYEGGWSDSGDPYWGGLQMDRGFMEFYAPKHLLRRGWANNWSPLEQMWVAERAYRSGRGFYPWPNTARMCGLI